MSLTKLTNVNFDLYTFRARLQPALLTLLPVALAIFAWTGPGEKWVSALWGLIGTVGGTFLLANVARNRGKVLEEQLWQSWGGPPTTQLLRHRGPANPISRARWHKSLGKLLGKQFPTAEEEANNSNEADNIYAAAVKLQIGKTRDTKKYPLVFKENVNYGFHRNFYAMKGMGITVSILGIIACCFAGIWFKAQIAPWACAALSVAMLIVWLVVVKASWIKTPAFAYAERLLESTEDTARPSRSSTGSK